MLQTSRERSPLSFFCCLLLGVSACTFPAIDYVEPGEADIEAVACAATPQCANEVDTCAKQAYGQRSACVSQCEKSGPMSLNPDCSSCDSALETNLNICVAKCESCNAADGCSNATDSCRALLGLP
ncbi:hypothetical protein [Polyangium jinanense]|uniref:Lipoprotein n=1 Tax=Polyangium jinanense TaxID=2829994 RepID=A0A9X4AV23_9BACT|nr:hypothetical protein [Polyangium jinanense]MDC3960758.1 hypothetical protein [Polyangium jinanense]MDC3985864.1 hypothetical protein [Polyangium jinanense]